MKRKGILLCGGTNSRFYPSSLAIGKSLFPLFNKPTVYYSLSILMLAGIREILIISTSRDLPAFQTLFGNGSQLGLKIQYKEQLKPNGIAESFIIAEKFIDCHPVCLVLGDNILHSHDLSQILKKINNSHDSTIFAYPVSNPQDFGVVKFNSRRIAQNIEEKPKMPKSNYAVIGIYFYDTFAVEIAKKLTPSARGELEISSLNQVYIKNGALQVEVLSRGVFWLDTGNCNSFLEACNYVAAIENRTGLKIAAIDEIAFRNGWIDKKQLAENIENLKNNEYSDYLKKILFESL